jgi:hypothetical protein
MRYFQLLFLFLALNFMPAYGQSNAPFYLQSKMGGFLDVTEVSSAAGTPLQLWEFTGSDNQIWFWERHLEQFVLRSKMGRYVELRNNSPARGTVVQIGDFNGSPSQQWYGELSDEPEYLLIRSKLGTYLDVHGHTNANGLPIQGWSRNAFYTQKWRILYPDVIQPTAIGLRCPTGWVGSDFGGSPRIVSSVELKVSDDRRQLIADITYWASALPDADPSDPLEDVGDPPFRSRFAARQGSAYGRWNEVVYTVPEGMRLIGVLPAYRYSAVDFWGPSAGFEFLFCGDGEVLSRVPERGPVRVFNLIGDTGDRDVSVDADCRCDAQIRGIEFNPIEVLLERE